MPTTTFFSTVLVYGLSDYGNIVVRDASNVEYQVNVPADYHDHVRQLGKNSPLAFEGSDTGKFNKKGRRIVDLIRFAGAQPPAAVDLAPAPQPAPDPVPVPLTSRATGSLSSTEIELITSMSFDLANIALQLRSSLIGAGVTDVPERIAILQSSLSAARDHVIGRAGYNQRSYE